MGQTQRGNGRLEDNTMAPDYMPEMDWMDPEQIEAHVKLLEQRGVKVHHTVPIRYFEELSQTPPAVPEVSDFRRVWYDHGIRQRSPLPDRSSTAGPLEPRTYSPNKSRSYSQWDLSSAFPTMRRSGE